jgi:acetate kinase
MATVLAVNAGSSSLKFAAFAPGEPPRRRLSGKVERIGRSDATLALDGGEGRQVAAPDHAAALPLVVDALASRRLVVEAVEHRIVHGGPRFLAPAQVSPELLDELRRISPFDPEHLPAGIALIEACSRRFPGLPRVACFDTAFHRDLPRVSRLLPIPRKYEAEGIRRYGFHGLSHAWASRRAGGGRVVTCHLGAGASLAAVRDGRCVDTTMGFTPLEGLVMATRSGSVDPGLLLWLLDETGMAERDLARALEHESGLLALAGTADMREVVARGGLALDVYLHRLRAHIAAMTAALGGLDALVFTGGVGERSPEVRAGAADGLAFLGVGVDPDRNARGDEDIGAGLVRVMVVEAREDLEIARGTRRVLGAS